MATFSPEPEFALSTEVIHPTEIAILAASADDIVRSVLGHGPPFPSHGLQCHRRVGHDSKQTSLGVFRPLLVQDQVSSSMQMRESDSNDEIDVPRTRDSTWSLRDSK